MSNRFPVSDEQVEPTNKNTMKKTLAKIEHLNNLLKDYEGIVRITEIVKLDELTKLCKQENLTIHQPTVSSPHYWSIFIDGNVQAFIQTDDLNINLVWE